MAEPEYSDAVMGREAAKLLVAIRTAKGDPEALAKVRAELDLNVVRHLCANTLAIISTFNTLCPEKERPHG